MAEIIISVVGDSYAQEELDANNAEAERYSLGGGKEFWRNRLAGKATYGSDRHPMTDYEFEADWADSEETRKTACRWILRVLCYRYAPEWEAMGETSAG